MVDQQVSQGYLLCTTCARFMVVREQGDPTGAQCPYLSRKITTHLAYHNAAVSGLPRPQLEALPIQVQQQPQICAEFLPIPQGPN
jgi:hypothetical protein